MGKNIYILYLYNTNKPSRPEIIFINQANNPIRSVVSSQAKNLSKKLIKVLIEQVYTLTQSIA